MAQVCRRCSCHLAPWRLTSGGIPSSPQWTEPLHPVHTRERIRGEDHIPHVQLERRGAGVLTSVFRKKTHTDQYLNFNSNHPTKVKRGIIQCLRHRAEKVCSGSTRWKELGHLRQVFKANAYPETVVNRNLRARPIPRISTQTSQTSPKLLLLPYIPGISERIKKTCQPLGVKTVSRPKCTLRSALVHVKQPREDKRKKVSFMKFHAKIVVCLHWRNRQNP